MTQTLRQYLESLNPNAPVPHQITVGDVLAIYEKIDAMTTAEQEQQAKECRATAEWLDTPISKLELDLMAALGEVDGCGNDDDLPAYAMGR